MPQDFSAIRRLILLDLSGWMLLRPRRIEGWRISEFAKETISKTFGQSVFEAIGTCKEIPILFLWSMILHDTESSRIIAAPRKLKIQARTMNRFSNGPPLIR
jgi:hypothetical protein